MSETIKYARLIEDVSRGRAEVYDAVITGHHKDSYLVIAIDNEDDDIYMGPLKIDEYLVEPRSKDEILRYFKRVLLTSEENLREAEATVKRRKWDLERDKERYDMVFKDEPWGH